MVITNEQWFWYYSLTMEFVVICVYMNVINAPHNHG